MSAISGVEATFSIDDGAMSPHGVFVHRTASVDESAKLFPLCYVGPNVTIGKHCVVGPGACIGQPGFGYEKQGDGSQLYRGHSMGVIIEDDVHIGANACVDQGRHRPTRIGTGSRIDNLVHIAHNVEIGRDCLVIACSMLAGSVVVGDGAQIAPSAAVRDWRTVGEGALVGLGAVVVKDVPDGATVMGVPAR